jgi:hypothetical protein
MHFLLMVLRVVFFTQASMNNMACRADIRSPWSTFLNVHRNGIPDENWLRRVMGLTPWRFSTELRGMCADMDGG